MYNLWLDCMRTLPDYAWIKPDHELKYRDPLIYIEQG